MKIVFIKIAEYILLLLGGVLGMFADIFSMLYKPVNNLRLWVLSKR